MISYGFCHCGCGQRTNIARQDNEKAGHIKGHPLRFLMNHDKRRFGSVEEATPFKIDGVYCRLVPLTRGQFAIVDAADYPEIAKHKWFALFAENTGTFYAARKRHDDSGKREMVRMHREILGLRENDPLEGDHIYPPATTDNRRKNLRIVTAGEQNKNKRIHWHSHVA